MREMKDSSNSSQGLLLNSRVAKSIPASRDRIQSDLLTGAIGFLLLLKLPAEIYRLHVSGPFHKSFYAAFLFSVVFAFFVWIIRSATAPAACMAGSFACTC